MTSGNGGAGGAWRRRIIGVAALALALLVVLLGWRAQRKVEHDTALCTTSCHHQSELVATDAHARGHADAECQQCHAVPARGAGLKLYWQSLVGTDKPEKHGKVASRACVACHEKSPAEWRLIAETQGHREHRGLKDVDCLSCHAESTHKDEPTEKVCTKCHDDQRLHAKTTANAESCQSCHSYTASKKRAREPSTLVCEKCHGTTKDLAASAGGAAVRPMREIDEHALHGGVACQLCHNAHGIKPKPPEGQPQCARCHQFEMAQVGKQEVKGPEGHRSCEGCHKPHAPKQNALATCVECHEKNAKGIAKLRSVVKPSGPAPGTKSNATTALKHESCASCHLPHTWRAERSGCMQCHEEQRDLFLARSPPQHETCVTCHEVHGPPPTGAVCVGCHKDKQGHVARAPAKHKDCTSCHNPHAPRPLETRTSCTKCHTVENAQVVRDGPDEHTKKGCYGCHQPHDNPMPSADLCGMCHGDKAKSFAAATAVPQKHRLCTSCHEKHKFKVGDTQAACAKCHTQTFTNASTSGDKHTGKCDKCHSLHGAPGVAKTTCLKCHDKVAAELVAPNEKHAACRSCHAPHKGKSAAIATCAGCHENKAAIAAKWPANSAHAKECTGCHQQHDVRTKKTCASCHSKESTSATAGKHKCEQCHKPHDAPIGFGAAWWGRCNECHAAKVESVKLRGPKHQQCKNCHEPHKFASPTCTSCHTDISSKGLHASPKHAANCKACHDPHVKGDPTPKQCLSCHTDKMNHQRDAAKCQGCHTFK